MDNQTAQHHHRFTGKIRKGFRKISDLYKTSSSYTPLNYPQPNQFGTAYYPISQNTHSYGAELHPDLRTSPSKHNHHISPKDEYDHAVYHYVAGYSPKHKGTTSPKEKMNESFHEDVPNRHQTDEDHRDGLRGVKVLDPQLTTDNDNASTMETDSRTSNELSPRPLVNLANHTVACGLQNLGNTCYMNSVLQCLFNIEDLSNYFLQGGHLLAKEEAPLTQSFVELLSTAFTKSVPVDNALMHFKDTLECVAPVFEGYAQNDAHEFFRLVIEKIHEELNSGPKRAASYREFKPSEHRMSIYQLADEWKRYSCERDNSIIHSIFGGILLNEVICNSCKYTSYTFEDALDLSLNLSNAPEASSSHYKVATSLYACLKRFTTPEPVEGYACESCHKKNTSFKRTMIWKQPDTLVVQFKRFLSDNYGHRKALKERVSFPMGTMSLDFFTHESSKEQRSQYKLQGIVNHYGELNSGHYIAYVYNTQMKSWLKYDDHKVTKVEEKEIEAFSTASVEPYILFYKRV